MAAATSAVNLAGCARLQSERVSLFAALRAFWPSTRHTGDGAKWYTVCGKPHTNFARWMIGTSLLGGLGVLVFSFLLGPLRRG